MPDAVVWAVFTDGILKGTARCRRQIARGCVEQVDFLDESGRQMWVSADRVFATEAAAVAEFRRLHDWS
jgi:hypothetical protein